LRQLPACWVRSNSNMGIENVQVSHSGSVMGMASDPILPGGGVGGPPFPAEGG
jgi:hypothetical protein